MSPMENNFSKRFSPRFNGNYLGAEILRKFCDFSFLGNYLVLFFTDFFFVNFVAAIMLTKLEERCFACYHFEWIKC